MIKRVKIYALTGFCIFLLCISGKLLATPGTNNTGSFKQITSEQGLPGINLRSQLQDEDGLIWICIEAEGLCKYDGHKFTVYKNDPTNPHSISSNYPNMISRDSNNNLWIATDNGLNMFEKNTRLFHRYYFDQNTPGSIPDNTCRSVFCDSDGNILVGTINGIAVRTKDDETFQPFFNNYEKDGIKKNVTAYNFIEYPKGTIWIASNIGLIKFNLKTTQYSIFNKSNYHENYFNILDLVPDNNIIWLATQYGIAFFDIGSSEFFEWEYNKTNDSDLINEGVYTILLDSKGKLWAGTYTKGIIVIDTKTLAYERITKSDYGLNTLRSNYIRHIHEDQMGLIWIGTKFGGLFKYNENLNLFTKWPDELVSLYPYRNHYLKSFTTDKEGNFWLGTRNEGLFKIDPSTGNYKHFLYFENQTYGLNSNRVEDVIADNHNKIWVATGSGINIIDSKNNTIKNLSSTHTNAILESSNGKIWIGTTKGVRVSETGAYEITEYISDGAHEFLSNHMYDVMQLIEDSSGRIWFSTRYNGLHSYHPESKNYKHFLFDEGEFNPRALFEDSNGRIWVTTKASGVLMIDPLNLSYSNFSTNNGLAGNMVFSIEEDSENNIWLGTNNGLSRLNLSDTSFINYNSSFGLRSNVAELGANYAFKTGELMFGGNNGFNVFNPAALSQNIKKPTLALTSFIVNDNEKIHKVSKGQTVKLNHFENFVSFEFSLADYNNPFKHMFSVKLEGFDNEWKTPDNRNYISYPNLKPGTYTFKVKGANEMGIWTEEHSFVSFKISKPFFKTILFNFIIGSIVLTLITLLLLNIRNRQISLEKQINERTRKLEVAYRELLNKNTKIREQNRQIERHHANLEQKVTERTRDLEIAKRKAEESDKLKSSFLANMSHEIRTPLNAISGFSSLVSSDMYSPERKNKYVSIIKSNITSLLKLVEDILDISKIEAGQLTIEKEFFDFNNMMSDINEIFNEEIKAKRDNNVSLLFNTQHSQNESIIFNSDQTRIRQILVNLLSNAIKFTTKGAIELGYKIQEKGILFWVKDSGIGIQKEYIDSIFDRFTKIEDKHTTHRGTGLGLSISKSLTDMLGGEMWVESELNKGSCFFFEIPGEIFVTNQKPRPKNKFDLNNLNLKHKRILVIEDEKSNFALIQSYLLNTKSEVIWAQDGTSGIEFCKQHTFDLILLDIRMPDIDGYETFERLKKITPNTPVIAQTAYATTDDKIKLSSTGFSSFIVKPYSKEELLERIDDLQI